jgi:hypothetical protein
VSEVFDLFQIAPDDRRLFLSLSQALDKLVLPIALIIRLSLNPSLEISPAILVSDCQNVTIVDEFRKCFSVWPNVRIVPMRLR